MPEQVQLLPDQGKVIKRFADPARFEKELFIYLKSPDFAPRLLDHNHHDELVIRYLDYPTVGQIDRPDFSAIGPLFHALHQLVDKVICHRDTNPRNYLQSPGKTWMIDFADWEYGRAEEDIIHFLLFWASNRSHEDFRSIVTRVTTTYTGFREIDPEGWKDAYERMVRAFDERRRLFGKREQAPSGLAEVNRRLLARWLISPDEERRIP